MDPTSPARTAAHRRRGRRRPPRSRRGSLASALAALVLALTVTACGSGPSGDEGGGPSSEGSAETASSESASGQPTADEHETTASAPASPSAEAATLDGLVIAVDPGHNGGNSGDPAAINAPVPDGRGGTKACNTVGTQTDDGYPEHRFNWETAQVLTDALEETGATVVLSRESDDGVGPCVDERGTFADDADALVSLHANGTEDRSARGFHVIAAPAGDRSDEDTADVSEELGAALVEELEAQDFTGNPAYDSPVVRDDLATLNHASVPAVMLEAGEMRSAADATLLASHAAQERIAEAIVAALTDTLVAQDP